MVEIPFDFQLRPFYGYLLILYIENEYHSYFSDIDGLVVYNRHILCVDFTFQCRKLKTTLFNVYNPKSGARRGNE